MQESPLGFLRAARALGAFHRGRHHLTYTIRPNLTVRPPTAAEHGEVVTVRQCVPAAPTAAAAAAAATVVGTWQDEPGILQALRNALPHTPHPLATPRLLARIHPSTTPRPRLLHSNLAPHGDLTVLAHPEAVPLSTLHPDGTPLDPCTVTALAALLADLARLRRRQLPPLPAAWPRSGRDGRAFLRALARTAHEQLAAFDRGARFGGLFAMLGIPENALVHLAERTPALVNRPFGLIHTDLHRDNVLVTRHGNPPLICLDWEPAAYGDPLHGLAAHLVRMRYPVHQWDEVVEAWRRAAGERCGGAVQGLDRDLGHCLAFERARAVHPEVMRAALSLGASLGHSLDDSPDIDRQDLATAARTVHTALTAAERPLRLRNLPDEQQIERILFRWTESQRARTHPNKPSRPPRPARHNRPGYAWKRDPRVPLRPDFPSEAVGRALCEEGAAPADHVFRGTSHLNTAVRVEGIGFPVMVRRRTDPADSPLERRFLNEHAVLGAIERTGVRVCAPRVLALGTSGLGEQFAIHTYEGPADAVVRPPSHPEYGLLPHESDHLVDQLAELAAVPCERIDPAHGEPDFSSWLRTELTRLVRELPAPTRDMARELGLPDAVRLDEILARHVLVPRRPVLLHGDLNPWNLVRRADGGITLIDWEMAMLGDPLYDLVRHLHLTPTRPDIRRRLLARWSRRLPDDCTKGWQDDWRAYRWIEIVRSAYVDLNRLTTAGTPTAPNVRRALDTYTMTLHSATAALGLPLKTPFPPRPSGGRT
ncbi:phosphotransferase [Streptomyces sp. NPDC096198]|uniref:phosphotransferase n=1 Tax=Streptomyces sp. NPDC096198 TaxID=3366080 RepID=UPI0038276DA4